MDAYIKTLQNSSKTEIIYPVTKAEAVYIDNDVNVQDKLNDLEGRVETIDFGASVADQCLSLSIGVGGSNNEG